MFRRHLYWSIALLTFWVVGLWGLTLSTRSQIVFPTVIDASDEIKDSNYQYTASGSAKTSLGIVYGFLPYWTLENYTLPPELTHLSYFRLAIDGRGNIVHDSGYNIFTDERFAPILQQIRTQKLNFEVTFFTSHSDQIYNLIKCNNCQQKLITQIVDIAAANNLDGINLDFEYLGTLTPQEQQTFTLFIYELKNQLLARVPRTKLSLTVYGGAGDMNQNLYDFANLGKIVDHVIIMAYDYKTKSSAVPGSTAPTLGQSAWDGNIWQDTRTLGKYLSAEKIILAVPFYGYAWETTSCTLSNAKTYPDSGETMTYNGAQNLLANRSLNVKQYWDEKSLTPYLVWQATNENGEKRCHIGFFENERSLEYKMDTIEQLQLGGIAIWALGYEGNHRELWDGISQRF
ncbi:hypothetical protein IJJ27_00425 [bacterium]|nr:hypothetical protein [bacterium]